MINWHRLFGLVLIDYFSNSPYTVELEKDLSLKQQFLDVIIIEQGEGTLQDPLPDGLESLRKHNLVTYKSHQESLDSWTLDELLGHYVNYRKQVSPSGDALLPSEEFKLYAVSTRYPRNLEHTATLRPIMPGVFDVEWGSQIVRGIVLSQMPQTERNALWQMFSAIPQRVQYGAEHYHWHIQDMSTLIEELYAYYQLEGISMSYTINDYYRDFTRRHLDWLTPEERLKGLPPEERLKGLPTEERLKGLPTEERLKGLPTEERLKGLPPQDVLQTFPLKERLKGLASEEVLKVLLVDNQLSEEQLEHVLQQLHSQKRKGTGS